MMNTRKLGMTLLLTLILLSIGYAGFAQRQPTPPFKGAAVPQPRQNAQPSVEQEGRKAGDSICIIALDILQYYLKLNKEQTAKIDPIVKRVRTELNKLQTMGTDAPPKLIAQFKLVGELFKSSDAEIDGILTSEQKKKTDKMFDEIRKMTAIGIDRDAIAQVKLTEKQKKDLIALSDEYQKKRAEIKPEDRQTEGAKLGKEYRAKASALLTEEQKATNEKVRASSQLNAKVAKP